METTVAALIASGKGILAADESFPTIEKRFKALNIASTEDNRRAYREMLFTTTGLADYIAGTILFDETIRQRSTDGASMTEVLANRGIVAGIKVDKGSVALAGFAGEKITEGVDGLRARLIEYRALGARFTKWRAVISIGGDIPTSTCIDLNAQALANFAALSQEVELVPIVEPEILMVGNHTIERCEQVATSVLESVFAALFKQRVHLEQMLLKTGMILPGEGHSEQADVTTVADSTLRCLRRTVPAAVPGVVFLSGGQSAKVATQRLNAICSNNHAPWKLSFSFARALQSPALAIWKGLAANVAGAQEALRHRAKFNSLATQGKYSVDGEGRTT
jgi:fructose-bisphosphate aldolase, class I